MYLTTDQELQLYISFKWSEHTNVVKVTYMYSIIHNQCV